jgi:hypothetical protein
VRAFCLLALMLTLSSCGGPPSVEDQASDLTSKRPVTCEEFEAPGGGGFEDGESIYTCIAGGDTYSVVTDWAGYVDPTRVKLLQRGDGS